MDRLLSEQEICKAVCNEGAFDRCQIKNKSEMCLIPSDHIAVAKAQDLKTSQWWVGKIEKISTECFEGGCKYEDGICRLMTYGSKHACLPWLSLKNEAGI